MARETETTLTWDTVATFSRRLSRLPHLAELVGARRVVYFPISARGIDAVIGWKAHTGAATAFASLHQLPYCRLEDGFVRSVGLGVRGDPPLSVVVDDRGIYYDAHAPSRLEELIAAGGGDLARARKAIDRIVASRISKYNDAPPDAVDLGPPRPRVLVVDQTRGDRSIAGALADERAFQAMLEAALSENPHAEVVVKTHPDVIAGKRRGYLEGASGDRVRLYARAAQPHALLAEVDRVYTVSSQLGLEAILAGKPVTCFGVPFYAGWGLTEDRAAVPRRGQRRSREELFAAAYLTYARYVDPDTGQRCELERVLDHLELQRRLFAANQGRIFCFGFRVWKRNYVRAYLRCPGNKIVFTESPRRAQALGLDARARIVVWGQRETPEVRALADRHGLVVERMEDGFLRSVGLGSDLTTPASLVLDRQGIYYDPTQASDLEAILERSPFGAEELRRANALRRAIVDVGLSKYNVGADHRLRIPDGRRVVLVPGQVEDDASVRLGCPGVRKNLALIEAARAAAPDAYLIYKPHPDVISGNRAGRVGRAAALALCDHVEEEASLAQCLEVAAEVHTLTSLVGFEALLREKRVVVYGQPFYAGWGLTEDRQPPTRRTRRLTLDELVAGVLIRYPRYLNRRTGRFTAPEAIVAELAAERLARAHARTVKLSWPRRQLRKLVYVYRAMVHAP